MNNILALDTATATLGLCLRTAGGLYTEITDIELKHSQSLLPRVRRLLELAGITPDSLEAIVCSLGPGSFTGVRIGLATAKGLALGSGARLIGVSNLDAFARPFRFFPGRVLPVLAALRGRSYAAFYRNGLRVSDYLDADMDELADLAAGVLEEESLLIAGPDCAGLGKTLRERGLASGRLLEQTSPASDPRSLLEIGLEASARPVSEDPEPLPLYLRKSDAELKLEER